MYERDHTHVKKYTHALNIFFTSINIPLIHTCVRFRMRTNTFDTIYILSLYF